MSGAHACPPCMPLRISSVAAQVLLVASEKAKGGQEIPIPVVTEVPSYSRDYLPTYRERPVYVRGRGEC